MKIKKSTIITSIIAVITIALLLMSFTIIPTGYTGVRTTFGQISEQTVPQGINFKIPLVQTIKKVNNKQQDVKLANKEGEKIWCESMEKVQVSMSNVTVTYQIANDKAAWIFAHVSNYEETLLSSGLVASALKNSAYELTTNKVTNRASIEPLAKKNIQLAIDDKYGKNTVEIIKVVIDEMDLEKSYNDAIATKNISRQTYEQSQIDNSKNVERAEAEAKAKLITAQGNATAAIAEAEGQAKANNIKNNSITDIILKQEFYDKWNGELPKVMGDNQSIIDIGE